MNISPMKWEFQAIKKATAEEAIESQGDNSRAIRYRGEFLLVDPRDADWLEQAGQEFAYLGFATDRNGTRRVVTVPVN